ncbi:MAG: GumC family protein [Syntrophorhabdales bacterium]|jgi:uncharacterized protein involved in exopolysaccharide biosynthesis
MNERRDMGSVRDILTILFKHKQKIIITFLTVVIAITVGTLLISPTYEAKSSLLVKVGREYLYTPEVGEAHPTPVATMGPEELLNSEVQILMDQDIIGKVITTLGIKNIYPNLSAFSGVSKTDAAISRFRKALVAEPVKKSNVIQVSFQHHNPEISAKAVNLLVDLYRQKHLQLYADPQSTFLSEQLAGYHQRLKDSVGRLEAFKQAHNLYSPEEQRAMLLKQRVEADTADKDAQNRIGEIQTRIGSLSSQMGSIEKRVPVTSEKERFRMVDDANAQLLTLRLREQELLEKYREDNRLVVNIRKEIAVLENFLTLQKENQTQKVITGKNPVYEEMEKEMFKAQAELVSLQSRRSSLHGQMALIDRELKTFDTTGTEFEGLKREVDSDTKNFQTYSERTEEARISDAMNRQKMANVTVIQQATVPTEPVKPRMGYNFLLALVLGSMSGLGLAFFSEYTGQHLSTPEIAEKRLALPVLGSIQNKG